jgi:inosine-uridine nucleoside N-ribohydrolase
MTRPPISPVIAIAMAALIGAVAGCASTPGRPTDPPSPAATVTEAPGESAQSAGPSFDAVSARTLLIDTDVAADDLVALAFLVGSPNVTIAAITVSGTGEAHCAGGVDVVLRLLERLDAGPVPVACGREQPLAGTHAFPEGWRRGVDTGSGLSLPSTIRPPFPGDAVSLIRETVSKEPGLTVLTLGPLTNLADALRSDPELTGALTSVVVMGGAVHVPGNLVGPDAPTDNSVAEWNIYVDPTAAQLVLEAGLEPRFVSLDGTNQVPVTPAFVERIETEPSGTGARILAELVAANPFMASGQYYLWDPLAAMLAAGYPVGTFTSAAITVEEEEGPESGYTRPTPGDPNAAYLSEVDPLAAEDTLLEVLNAR